MHVTLALYLINQGFLLFVGFLFFIYFLFFCITSETSSRHEILRSSRGRGRRRLWGGEGPGVAAAAWRWMGRGTESALPAMSLLRMLYPGRQAVRKGLSLLFLPLRQQFLIPRSGPVCSSRLAHTGAGRGRRLIKLS